HDGVDLTRVQRVKLGGAFDEPADPVLEGGLCFQIRSARRCRGMHSFYTAGNPSAASTLARSLRLPMTLAIGDGDTFARLGVTTTPSSSARRGCSQTSTISSLYAPARCCRQMASRFAMALTELGALPAMYRRRTTTVVTGAAAALVFLRAFARLRATSRLLAAVALRGIRGPAGAAALRSRSGRRRRRIRAAQSA